MHRYLSNLTKIQLWSRLAPAEALQSCAGCCRVNSAGAKPRLPPRAGAGPCQSSRISGSPEHEIFCMMVQGSASTSLPPLRADASSSALIDSSWFCIQVSLHHHLQNLQSASSDTKLVRQVTISHPPAFTSAAPGHTEVMLLPDCKCWVWEMLASRLFYTFSAGLDCEWEIVLCMGH